MIDKLPALLPEYHPQLDLFVADLHDVNAKGDQASMEHPIFSLKPCHTERFYQYKEHWIRIFPSHLGSATISDRDIILFCISQCVAALNVGRDISPIIRFIASDLMIATNRNAQGGSGYTILKNALHRLLGTRIETNIINGSQIREKAFTLLHSFEIIRETNGRMTEIEITLPLWIYDAIQHKNILTINRKYFRLRKPLEKRMYEIARKHCGTDPVFKIKLSTFLQKSGAQSSFKEFKRKVSNILDREKKEGYFPDYGITFDDPAKLDPNLVFCPKPELLKSCKIQSKPKSIPLKSETIEKAKQYALHGDVYALREDWEHFVKSKNIILKKPDGHFIDFCQKRCRRFLQEKQLKLFS